MHKRKDILWIAVVATLILTFSAIPNCIGYYAQTDKLAYKGTFFDPQDFSVHMSMLRAGMQGDWAYQFRYTIEPHQAAYTRLFYIILGQINRLFKVNPIHFFEISRWLFGYAALLSIYALTKLFFKDIKWQRVSFLLAVIGSGLGWLQLIFKWVPGSITPIDFWLIDAYVFFGITLFPHFSFVTAALCTVFLLYLDYLKTGNWSRIALITSITIVTQLVNPIAFILVDAALVIATIFYWREKKNIFWQQLAALGVCAIAQIPLLVYNYNLLTFDPFWSLFTHQNKTLSPPPIYYLWGFGFLWLFSLIGLFSLIRQSNPALLGAAAWIIVGFTLAYAPFVIQRRFLHGVTIPLALLATRGIAQVVQTGVQRWPFSARYINSTVILSLFFLSFSSIYLTLGRSLYLLNLPSEYFYPSSLVPALKWLSENAKPNDFVLSATQTGQLVTQNTDLRVYLGHEMETLDYERKSHYVKAFYNGGTLPGWLESTKVQWVIYGPYERSMVEEVDFPTTNLKTAYFSTDVVIYQVNP